MTLPRSLTRHFDRRPRRSATHTERRPPAPYAGMGSQDVTQPCPRCHVAAGEACRYVFPKAAA